MKNILLTGGAGFIGFHLASYLQKSDCSITIMDNLSRGASDGEFTELLDKPNVRFVQADMTKKDFYQEMDSRYDEIYHLAAVNGTKNFYLKPEKVLTVNILSLLNLLEWINPENCGKFLFSSSSEAYAGTISEFGSMKEYLPTKEDIPLTVSDVFNPRFSYGGSKLTGELLTIHLLNAKGIKYSIVRYHNIYGPRMGFDHVIPEFCERIFKKTNPFPIYGGEETRAFCYIDDCTSATKMVMEAESSDGEVVHIGNSSQEYKISDLAELLMKIAGCDARLEIKPAPEGSVKRRCPDTEKLKRLTGFEAEIDLERGLRPTYEWYMQAFNKK